MSPTLEAEPRRSTLLTLFTALCCAVLGAPARTAVAENADLIIRGGKIVTMDDDLREAEALAVLGQRIIAVGDNQSVDRFAGPATTAIELNGQLVLPGFIEGHGHFLGLGRAMMILDLKEAASWPDIVALVRRATAHTPKGVWILGRGWHQDKWTALPESHLDGYPPHDLLSRATPDHPVMLTHASGHMCIANALAMQLAGVTDRTTDGSGGEIVRDAAGQPIGVFRENAMAPIRRAASQSNSEQTASQQRADFEEAVRLASRQCLRHGVTSFQDAGSSFAEVDALRDLAERGELPIRLWVMVNEGNASLAANLARYRLIGAGDHYLTVRGIKRLLDGALGTRGAWLLAPYEDLPTSTGLNTLSIDSLRRTAELALEHDVQLCVHAIGDRANRETLDTFEEAFESRPDKNDLRWRVEHAQHLAPADIPRFRELGVIASMQGVHCTSDAPFVVKRLGETRARHGAYVWRSLLDSGAFVINGTDTPVESVAPLQSFISSVTRRTRSGQAFFPEQCMTRIEALASYTRAAAYAAFEENQKGSLEPGKLADIVVLSEDLTTVPQNRLAQTEVLYTIVGGKVRYRQEPGNAP